LWSFVYNRVNIMIENARKKTRLVRQIEGYLKGVTTRVDLIVNTCVVSFHRLFYSPGVCISYMYTYLIKLYILYLH